MSMIFHVLAVFIVSMGLSLVLTPLAKVVGRRLGMLDAPGGRKIHHGILPRSGGLAIFFSVILTLGFLLVPQVSEAFGGFRLSREALAVGGGACLVFLAGVLDDIFRLNAKLKLLIQILSASLAFWGGVRIDIFPFFAGTIDSLWISYTITIGWFILVINSINLIDGVDGLAGGIVLFACIIMSLISVNMPGHRALWQAFMFAAIGGSVLGFLRYNFNPASIFMGDGGSYFLGFCLAGLSVIGSIKTQVGSALLIPVVALGVPLFDTFLAPVRRFVRGRKVFSPDKGHLHHKLLARGYSTRQVVLLLYFVTAILCSALLLLVLTQNKTGGVLLGVLALVAVFLFKKIGYLEYIVVDKMFGWFYDMLDTSGLTTSRRTFLNHQLEISRSQSLDALWENLCPALERLGMDMAELHIYGSDGDGDWCRLPGVEGMSAARSYRYIRYGVDVDQEICRHCMLKIELPLLDASFGTMGILWLVKDLKRDPLPRLALRRVEQLRRSVVDALQRIHGEQSRESA